MARATCEKVDECCSTSDRARVLGAGDDLASCEVTLGSFYGRQYEGARSLVAMERVQYDAERARECLAAYKAGGCAAPGLAAARACAGVLTGEIDNGGACTSSFECRSRLCVAVGEGRGECRPRKADGQPCTRAGECASGLCRTNPFVGMCTSQPPDGPSCGGDGFWLTF